jgi:hypothetical protein
MHSYLEFACPGCGRDLRVRDTYIDQVVFCNHCDQPFVPQAELTPQPIPTQALGAVDESAVDDSFVSETALDRENAAQSLQLERAERSAELEQLQALLLETRAELAHNQERVNALCAERDSAQSANNRLLAAHDQLIAEVERLRLANDGKSVELERFAAEFSVLDGEHTRAEAKNVQLVAEIERLIGESNVLGGEHALLVADNGRLAFDIDRLTDERDSLIAAHTRVIAENGRLAVVIRDRDVAVAEMANISADRDRLASVLDERVALIAGLETALASAHDQHGDALRTTADEFQRASDLWNSERQQIAGTIETLRESHARADLAARIAYDQLATAHAEHSEERDALQVEITRLRGEVGRVGRHFEQIHLAAAEVFESAQTQFQEELASLKEHFERNRAESAAQRERAERLLAEQRHQLDAKQADLEKALHEHNIERQAHLRSQAEIELQIEANRSASERVAKLQEENETTRREAERWRARHTDANETAKALASERDNLAARLLEIEQILRSEREDHALAFSMKSTERSVPQNSDPFSEPMESSDEEPASWVGEAFGEPEGEPTGAPMSTRGATGTALAIARDPQSALREADDQELDAPWPEDEPTSAPEMPHVATLGDARRQIALLSRLLETAQVANRMLRAHFTERGMNNIRRQLREMTDRAQQLEAEVQAFRGKEETLWHVGVAQRAKKLDRKG